MKGQGRLILVTGATGYVGGRLVPRLLEAGYRVRCLVRDARRLHGRPWIGQAEIIEGDLLRLGSLGKALEGVDTAYYMVHSLHKGKDFHINDTKAASNFVKAATAAGIRHIIYLGQLGQPEANASPYMRSRHETGDILRSSGIPVTEFRAGVIVGSGSITFEMIRYLVERWPFLVCPLWAYTFSQPIAIRDVLFYLLSANEENECRGQIIEIGGPDQLTYAEMLLGYSVERGLARWMIPVGIMTPYFSAYWVHFITPIPASVARPLIEEMISNAIVTTRLAQEIFPDIRPISYHRAVRLAIGRIDSATVETSWSDSLVSSIGEAIHPVTLTTTEGFLIEKRQLLVNSTPESVFNSFTSLGGENGWLFMNWTWQVRGFFDRMTGGVGLRRGRRHPENVHIGDALDFWRVEELVKDRLMRLRAEMNLPGKAWLEFQVELQANGKTLLSQTAFFEPKGVAGFLYWYLLYPIHSIIFSGMIRRIGARAVRGNNNNH